MSTDFAFWKQASADPGDVFDNLAEGDTDQVVFSEDVVDFRKALLSRWPELVSVLEPSDYDLQEAPEDAGKYVLLTLSVRQLDFLPEIIAAAKERGLAGYSGVAGEAI